MNTRRNCSSEPLRLHSAIAFIGRRAFVRLSSRLSRYAVATRSLRDSLCGPLIQSTVSALAEFFRMRAPAKIFAKRVVVARS